MDIVPSSTGSVSVARHLLPSAAATMLAFLLVAVDSNEEQTEFVAAAFLVLLVLAISCIAPWSSLPRALRLLPCVLFLLAVFLLRDSLGGALSGVGFLSLLPIGWLALYGTRNELLAGLTALAAFATLPIVLGGEDYPALQLRGVAMYIAVTAVIGLTVQRLVAALGAHADNISRVAAAARAVLVSADARSEICEAVCEVSGASYAILVEPTPDGRLRSTATAGAVARQVTIDPGSATSATNLAFDSGQAVWAKDAARHPALNRRLWEAHGRPTSMLFEPVLQGEAAVGVLIAGWAQRVPNIHKDGPALVALLAAEAATAIAHADLVEQLGRQAATDALTGLPNRRAWKRALDRVMHDEAGRDFCVAMLDLDHFKAYNDRHGHLAGDRQLKQSAAAWQSQLRPGDVLARLGGEEFGVLLTDCALSDAVRVIERLRFATPGEQTCSAGLVMCRDGETADELTERADAALYRAKHAGRDQLSAVGH